MRRRLTAVLGVVLTGLLGPDGAALAQPEPQANPVYLDDAPTATEALSGVPSQLASGNTEGALRVLQRLLDESADRVASASADDPDLFVSIRSRVHEIIQKAPGLLQRYRDTEGPKAARALEQGEVDRVERVWLLTPAGFDAALRLAQRELESARFESALQVLRQIESHPDRKAEKARDSADLLMTVARYLDRADVWERAERWTREAGGATGLRTPETWPELARRRGLSPLDSSPSVNLKGMLPRPLWTVPIGTTAPTPLGRGGGTSELPTFGQVLWTLPTISGEVVYTNDGRTISAWDRFTLSRRWSVTPVVEPPAMSTMRSARSTRPVFRGGRAWRGIEDFAGVAAAGRDVIAVTGVTGPGMLVPFTGTDGRTDVEAIHAIDATSGKVRWSVQLPELDPLLLEAGFRGPVLANEGTVIVGARKSSTLQRLTSLYLIGLDQGTGKERWRRLVGSVGVLPYGGRSVLLDGGVLCEGVVYRCDSLGVVGAYEAGTGRCIWVRRMGSPAMGAAETANPWETNVPIIDGNSILLVSPDRSEVVRIDRETGRLLGRRGAGELTSPGPQYLLRAGQVLAAIGSTQIAMVNAADLEHGTIRQVRIKDPGIRGRVVAGGDSLIVPTAEGVTLVSAISARVVDTVRLENPGNVLPMSSQLVVADDAFVHSYLLWDEAERVLRDRMTKDPSDAGPAVTFAELAYRAGRAGQILGAVDAAVSALDRAPAATGNENARQRLWASIVGMVNSSQEAEPTPADALGKLADAELIGALIQRLGRIASTADERVTYLLTSGRFNEGMGEARRAVETYQKILDDPALAAATWTGPRVSLRGELEAAWRLERLMREQGGAIYAPYDAQARSELQALGATPSDEGLERLARRYPVSTTAPAAWLRIGASLQARGRSASGAYESGLRAALRRSDADPSVIADLTVRLAAALESGEQWGAAAKVLRSVHERCPTAPIRDPGGSLDAPAWAASLEQRWAHAHRWPSIGRIGGDGAQVLAGWSLLKPGLRDMRERSAQVLVMEDGDSVAVFSPSDAPDGPMVKAWSMPTATASVSLMRIEQDSAFIFIETNAGTSLARVNAGRGGEGSGTLAWRTATFTEMFAGRADAAEPGAAQQIQTPNDGAVSPSDLVYRTDERTIALVDRTGRAVGIDALTGSVLWAARLPVPRVYEVDLRSGVLAVGGEDEAGRGGDATGNGVIVLLDARSGQLIHRLATPGGRIRWLWLADDGAVVAGAEQGLVSYDANRGEPNWTVADPTMASSVLCWPVGDRLFVLGMDRRLWAVSARDGKVPMQPVRVPPEQLDESQIMYAAIVRGQKGQEALALSTLRGMVVLSTSGELLGVDALGGMDALIPAQPGEGVLVTAETIASSHEADGLMVFNLHVLDSASARLIQTRGLSLGSRPRRLAVIDGRIAVTAGSTTVIVRAR